MPAHRRVEVGPFERCADLGPRPVIVVACVVVGVGRTVRIGMRVIVMVVIVVAVLVVAVLVPVRRSERGLRRGVGRAGSEDQEAAALEDAVVVG
ncbi:hypothetical protein, partial [Methylobacterium sp. WL103]|uniref:hypothetical protein n=1 Tax=Methylobacterium sp. WL103 TaxID=2603891 RepID=UPI0032B14B36